MSKKIRLLHITTSLKRGGAEQVLVNLIEHLPTDVYEQVVIYMHEGPHLQTLEQQGIACYHVRGLLLRYDPVFFIRLIRLVYRLKPDIMHSLLWTANSASRLVARCLRIPLIHAYHNKADHDGRMRNWFDRLSGARFVPAIAASKEAADSLSAKGLSVPSVTVITNGVKYDQLLQEQGYTRASLGLTPYHMVVGMVARFERVKNHELVLRALALLCTSYPHMRLVLVGDGAYREHIQQVAQDLGIADRIVLMGDQPASRYYSLFDCFVLPSFSEGGISLALQEAMSFGIPCIVSREANVHGLISAGISGLVCDLQDPGYLAGSLAVLAEHPELRKKLGIAGRIAVQERCSIAAMVAGYHEVFVRHAKGKSCG